MDQSYKQLFTELLAKVVSLEVEKKQLEEKNKQLQVEVENLKEKSKQTPEKSPLEKTIDEIEKACPGLLPKNSLEKNYPNLFKAEKEKPKQTPEKSPLENMLDEIEKAYPGLIQTSENKKTSEDETVYHVDIADLGKKFVRIFMDGLMDELDPRPL